MFGEKMPNLVAEIKKNANKFGQMPIGPIGLEIKLKKDISKQEAALMDALVRGFALVPVLCLTVAAARFPEACADPDVQTLIDVQNSCTSANSSCNIMIPVSSCPIR